MSLLNYADDGFSWLRWDWCKTGLGWSLRLSQAKKIMAMLGLKLICSWEFLECVGTPFRFSPFWFWKTSRLICRVTQSLKFSVSGQIPFYTLNSCLSIFEYAIYRFATPVAACSLHRWKCNLDKRQSLPGGLVVILSTRVFNHIMQLVHPSIHPLISPP